VTKRARALVSGRVQGVFFRAECARHARELGLGGSVRNLPDGQVEAVFEGPAEAVDQAVRWCSSGPTWARVERVEVAEEQPVGEGEFRIT
jgi:acylphosphatase